MIISNLINIILAIMVNENTPQLLLLASTHTNSTLCPIYHLPTLTPHFITARGSHDLPVLMRLGLSNRQKSEETDMLFRDQ